MTPLHYPPPPNQPSRLPANPQILPKNQKIINANIEIKNTGKKAMHCQYYVSFFDKDGKLIGCASQGTFSDEGLASGESTQLGSCLIPLPAGFHEKVVQYKVAFYESDKPIGK